MREIEARTITETVRELCKKACVELPPDVEEALAACAAREPWAPAAATLGQLLENLQLAKAEQRPICQDTGMACVFIELGQEVHITGGSLQEAIDEGVRLGYAEGFLRKSVVGDPLRRQNTGDNTPAFLHIDLAPGEGLHITVAPKGIGSENMSRLAMLPPSSGEDGVVDFVVETVYRAGGNPCPPVVVGVGLGGNFSAAPLLAKKALLRPLGQPNEDPYYAQLEARMLKKINALGVGPQGFGGQTTALGVAILPGPTHIAGLPVAVNLNCHAARHASASL